eukprot:CAMPEP_0119125128 /NCGR_PEP_ID=MMETSP1310-20130426/4504_1 /TAXON_ID=464262 /ORGANISM="Genus nov. species nov., Strain RCC2339" /LENGTH=1004 /DNA_ID=CAMNT_0007115163 /DNA_START=202 /DNA_END=3213 /DNA_ORIENTATION=+
MASDSESVEHASGYASDSSRRNTFVTSRVEANHDSAEGDGKPKKLQRTLTFGGLSSKSKVDFSQLRENKEGDMGYHSVGETEKTAAVLYVNHLLKDDADLDRVIPVDPNSFALCDAIKDGILLCRLYNALFTDHPIPKSKIRTRRLSTFTIIENHNVFIDHCKKVGCTVVNIGPRDLSEGQPHLVFGLVWQLIKISHLHQIETLLRDLDMWGPAEEGLKATPLLLRWVNASLENTGVTVNGISDFKSSIVYAKLLHFIAPSLFGHERVQEVSDEPDETRRATTVIVTVQRDLGVYTCISAGDIRQGSSMNLMLLSALYCYHLKQLRRKRKGVKLKKEIKGLFSRKKEKRGSLMMAGPELYSSVTDGGESAGPSRQGGGVSRQQTNEDEDADGGQRMSAIKFAEMKQETAGPEPVEKELPEDADDDPAGSVAKVVAPEGAEGGSGESCVLAGEIDVSPSANSKKNPVEEGSEKGADGDAAEKARLVADDGGIVAAVAVDGKEEEEEDVRTGASITSPPNGANKDTAYPPNEEASAPESDREEGPNPSVSPARAGKEKKTSGRGKGKKKERKDRGSKRPSKSRDKEHRRGKRNADVAAAVEDGKRGGHTDGTESVPETGEPGRKSPERDHMEEQISMWIGEPRDGSQTDGMITPRDRTKKRGKLPLGGIFRISSELRSPRKERDKVVSPRRKTFASLDGNDGDHGRGGLGAASAENLGSFPPEDRPGGVVLSHSQQLSLGDGPDEQQEDGTNGGKAPMNKRSLSVVFSLNKKTQKEPKPKEQSASGSSMARTSSVVFRRNKRPNRDGDPSASAGDASKRNRERKKGSRLGRSTGDAREDVPRKRSTDEHGNADGEDSDALIAELRKRVVFLEEEMERIQEQMEADLRKERQRREKAEQEALRARVEKDKALQEASVEREWRHKFEQQFDTVTAERTVLLREKQEMAAKMALVEESQKPRGGGLLLPRTPGRGARDRARSPQMPVIAGKESLALGDEEIGEKSEPSE